VGECGLDFYRDPSPEEKEKQHSWFHLQCELAIQYSKPLIVHTRSAWKETVEILKQHRIGRKTPGVIHFFSGTLHEAEEVLKEGVHLSVTGVVTFPRSDRLREVIKTIPLSSLMVETDSPYATPVPYRGKRNEPAFLVEIVQKIAEIRSLPLQEVSEVLWRTSKEFFRFYPG
jgi:TatD DNase family protein